MASAARAAIPRTLRSQTTACNPSDDLLSRFSDAAKHAPVPRPPPLPGARPRRRRPFRYNILMKSFSRAGQTDEVLRLFHEMKSLPDCQPNMACYSTVIHALLLANRPHDAEALLDEMELSGIPINVAACTILIKLYACHLRAFEPAYRILFDMERRGCNPNVFTYSTLISGLCRAGRVREAWGVLDKMLESGRMPDAVTYTPIIQSYCSERKIGVAKRLISSMTSIGCPPDTVTYNVLIHALCEMGNFYEVDSVLRESTSKGWIPDTVTYNTYISGLCKAGKASQSLEQLDIMLEKFLLPTTVTLNILLNCLCRNSMLWEVKSLLERSFDVGLDFDVFSYNTVMTRMSEAGNWIVVLNLFADMLKKGIAPSTRSFNIVINCLCKAGKLNEAKRIFKSIAFVADVVTYNILIHGFYVAGKIKELHHLFNDMVEHKVAPDKVTWSIKVDHLCRAGRIYKAIHFVRYLEEGFNPELVAHLVHWLVIRQEPTELQYLLEQMCRPGLILDGCIFGSLIKAFCNIGFCEVQRYKKSVLFWTRCLA